MLFNLSGHLFTQLSQHLAATTFRCVRYENSPVWLQNIMAKSGLFTDHLVKMAQIITWWWKGADGTFTYWPDGPLAAPKRLEHPLWNTGLVVQNELMFHRGDPVGRPDERDIPGLAHRSMFEHRPDEDDWVITTDGEVIRRYATDEIRFLVHWNAEVYTDLDECRRVMDHTDDLTHERVIDTLITDLRSKGIAVSEPSDPLHDDEFIHTLLSTYTIAPTIDWIERPDGVRI
jgi:hypothetical protein